MLLIENAHAEKVKMVYNGECIVIEGGCSHLLSDIGTAIITFEHFGYLNCSGTKVDKLIDAVAKSTVLIVNSTFFFDDISKNASIIVRRGVYEYSTGDFGYLYFDVLPLNCKCSLISCNTVNQREVLRTQKLIRMGEGYDFPPFSIISALLKYNKIKKMCSKEKIFNFMLQKHNY